MIKITAKHAKILISIVIIALIGAYVFIPKDIYAIMMIELPSDYEGIQLQINHKQNILDDGLSSSITDPKKIEAFYEFMTNYKFQIRPFTSYKDFDNKEFYYFDISNTDGNILKGSIIDKHYLLVTNILGLHMIYEIESNDIDTDFLDSLTN